MPLKLEDKKIIVNEIKEAALVARSAVIADSRGVTVSKMDALRRSARENGVWLKVVRNTLAKRALQGTSFECLTASFTGPSILAFSNDHPGAGARILRDFAKDNEKLELRVAAFEGGVVDVSMLATLPTYEEALARLMSVMKEAAAGKLVRTFAAIRDQKDLQSV